MNLYGVILVWEHNYSTAPWNKDRLYCYNSLCFYSSSVQKGLQITGVCKLEVCESLWQSSNSQITPAALTCRLKFHPGRHEGPMKALIHFPVPHRTLTGIKLADRYTSRQQAGEKETTHPLNIPVLPHDEDRAQSCVEIRF